MATSGAHSVVVTTWDVLIFEWTLASQSVANNTSTVKWSLKLRATSDGYISSSTAKNWSVKVGGHAFSGQSYVNISNNSTKTLASGTTAISHADDGTCTFNYSFSQEFNIVFNGQSIGTKSGSSSGTLDTIPRASQPSCVTWPEHTRDVGEFGDTISIHMNRKASVFTHTVRYQFGAQSGTIATNVGTGTTWTIPLSLMDLIPNTTKGSGTIYVDTYNGSTFVGTKSCGFTATVPASVKPTCSLKLEDISGVGDIYGVPVQGLSKIKITVNTSPAYGSRITKYEVEADDVNYSTAVSTTGALKTAGASPITAKVTDTRGRTNAAAYTMNVLAYEPPNISMLTVHRCDEDGTENDQGEFVRVVFSAEITSLTSINTATYKVRYKKSTDYDFTEQTLGNLANVYTVDDGAYIFAADSSSSYDVEVVATDRHGTATRKTSASTAFTLINWGEDGTSMGIGKVAEKWNTLQIALDVEFLGKVTGAIFDAILPVGSIVMRYDHTDPGDLYPGTKWARIYGAFPWFTDAAGQIGLTGGERTVKLTVNNLPAHNHGATYTNAGDATKTHAWLASGGSAMAYEAVDTGAGQPHNNMPPYIQLAAWRRTE